MFQVWAALEVLPLCQLKPFRKENTDVEVSSLQAPLCLVAVQRLFTVSDWINFSLATGTWCTVTAEMRETIPGSLRTLLLNRVDVACVGTSWMLCGLLGPEALMPEIMYACGDRESPVWQGNATSLDLSSSWAFLWLSLPVCQLDFYIRWIAVTGWDLNQKATQLTKHFYFAQGCCLCYPSLTWKSTGTSSSPLL